MPDDPDPLCCPRCGSAGGTPSAYQPEDVRVCPGCGHLYWVWEGLRRSLMGDYRHGGRQPAPPEPVT